MAGRLLQRGANINYVNSNGQTALHICLQNKELKQIRFLLEHGANPYIMNFTGKDCCDIAKEIGWEKKFKILN